MGFLRGDIHSNTIYNLEKFLSQMFENSLHPTEHDRQSEPSEEIKRILGESDSTYSLKNRLAVDDYKRFLNMTTSYR